MKLYFQTETRIRIPFAPIDVQAMKFTAGSLGLRRLMCRRPVVFCESPFQQIGAMPLSGRGPKSLRLISRQVRDLPHIGRPEPLLTTQPEPQ